MIAGGAVAQLPGAQGMTVFVNSQPQEYAWNYVNDALQV